MEDEVQLQSLAKRLINIYNACKSSATKLHLRKKRHTSRNRRDFEEITEVETESSARTVFVYNRYNRKKTNTENGECTALKYSEGSDRKNDIIHLQYRNDPAVNICNCGRCVCDPEKKTQYELVDRRRSPEHKKKNSLVISLTPTDAEEDYVPAKNGGRCCCCSEPGGYEPARYEQVRYEPAPTIMKKSSNKPQKSSFMSNNRDCVCQCPPEQDKYSNSVPPSVSAPPPVSTPPSVSSPPAVSYPPPVSYPPSVSTPPPVCTFEPFCPYYPPPAPPPKKSSNGSKGDDCRCCPASAKKIKKCCDCPPSPQNTSFCCQCPPPKPANTCCQCSSTPPSTSGCCQCPPSPTNSLGCCYCPPPPPPKSECCYCPPPPPPKSECCYCPPPPPPKSECCYCPPPPTPKSECCYCPPPPKLDCCTCPPPSNIGCQCYPPPSCCDCEESPPEDNCCNCQTEDINPTVIHADRIIIPTCYFNEGEASGNDSLAVSEEVKTEMLNDASSDRHRYVTSDKNVNTSCVVIRSCNSGMKKGSSQGSAPAPIPVIIPPKAPSLKSARDCCKCRKKEHIDQMINTSCAVVTSCPKVPPVVVATSAKCKPGVCCKCQQKSIQKEPSTRPTNHQILVYPSDQNYVPAPMPSQPQYSNGAYQQSEMVAKYSPQPFSDQVNPSYGGYIPPPVVNQPNPPVMQPPVYSNDYPAMGAGLSLPPRFPDHTPVLKSQSTPLCCNLSPKGDGDQKIPGVNDETEAQIYITLQKIETSLRDEADMHSRNMRCIVDQVCKQAGTIKELKVLVTGVVEEKKRTPSCKQVEKKIKKLEKRKEKESKQLAERELEEKERKKREAKELGLNPEDSASNLCCKCRKKKPMGCCAACCAKRCFGCCGWCCKGCCPKCCDFCCGPCERCCPCCCGFARCCDKCWSCKCCPRRKKKCKCTK